MSLHQKFLVLFYAYSVTIYCQKNDSLSLKGVTFKYNKDGSPSNLALGSVIFNIDSNISKKQFRQLKEIVEEDFKSRIVSMNNYKNTGDANVNVIHLYRILKEKEFYIYCFNESISEKNKKKLDEVENFYYGNKEIYDLLFPIERMKNISTKKDLLYKTDFSDSSRNMKIRPNFISNENINRKIYQKIKKSGLKDANVRKFIKLVTDTKINLEDMLSCYKESQPDKERYNKALKDVWTFRNNILESLLVDGKLKVLSEEEIEEKTVDILAKISNALTHGKKYFKYKSTVFYADGKEEKFIKEFHKFSPYFNKSIKLVEEFEEGFKILPNGIKKLQYQIFKKLFETNEEMKKLYEKTFSIFLKNEMIYIFTRLYIKDSYEALPAEEIEEVGLDKIKNDKLDKYFKFNDRLNNGENMEKFEDVTPGASKKILDNLKRIFLIRVFNGKCVDEYNVSDILSQAFGDGKTIKNVELYDNLIKSIEDDGSKILDKEKRNKIFCVSKLFLMIKGVKNISVNVFLTLVKIIVSLYVENNKEKYYDGVVDFIEESVSNSQGNP